MKLSFQVCNVEHPNSCKNSCVFAVFEAPDTAANLHIALETFRSEIDDLCGKELWRYNSQSMHISHFIIILRQGEEGKGVSLWRLCISLHYVRSLRSIRYYIFKHVIYMIVNIILRNAYTLCLSGRHSCLWCHIRTDDMKVPRKTRGPSQERSLDTLAHDYQQYLAAGGDIRKAKDFNNVIGPYVFEIPLNQVRYMLPNAKVRG